MAEAGLNTVRVYTAPPDDVLDSILPVTPTDARPRHALVSTHRGGYDSVPDPPTLDRIAARATLLSTLDDDRLWVELALLADGTTSVRHGPQMAGSQFVTFCVCLAAMLALFAALYQFELAGKRLDARLRELRELLA